MALHDELSRTGNYLFRWRSYWPLAFVALVLLLLRDFQYLGDSETLDHFWEAFCLGIAAAGLALRAATVGFVPANTSGRNTRKQKADALNRLGMYSMVRHPLYLGNFFVGLGVALFPHQWWLAMIYALLFWVYYERIMFAEEAFLRQRFGAEFEDWASRTPAFIPKLGRWQPPAMPFSWKSVLSREHSSVLGVIAIFTLFDVAGDFYMGVPAHLDPWWGILFSATLLLSLVTRWMKRRGLLAVPGR